jgi:hypothetical protein
MGFFVILVVIFTVFPVYFYFRFTLKVHRIYRLKRYHSIPKLNYYAIIIQGLMPVWGFIALELLKSELEFFDWRYLHSVVLLLFCCLASYFLSYYLKRQVGPLLHFILACFMLIGIVLLGFMVVHMCIALPFAIIPPMVFYGLPVYAIIPSIILMIFELSDLYYFLKNKVTEKEIDGLTISELLLQWSPFLLPISVIYLAYNHLVNQRSSAIVKAFTEAHEGLFANGACENCPPVSDYLCTIAAQGFPSIVKPLRMGVRLGKPLVVNRQLLVSNAFEEWLFVNFPLIHKPIRKVYDALNIPVNRWCKYKLFATSLYFLWKPLEWIGLVFIYLFVKEPEDMINRQYYIKRSE